MKKKEYKKKCPYCGKEIASLSKNQFDFNYYSHVGNCKKKSQADELKGGVK